MKNIQIFIFFPPIAGQELYPRVQNFIKAFENLGLNFKIAYKRKNEDLSKLLFSIPNLIKTSIESKYILVFVSNSSFVFILIFKLLFRKKVIVDHFATEESAFRSNNHVLKTLEKISYKIADLVLTHTESMQRVLCKYYGIAEEKVVPIYCFVDTELFNKTYNKRLKSDFELSEDSIVLVYHGLFHPWHGLPFFLRALPGIIKNCPNIICVFIGATYENALTYTKEFKNINRRFLRFVPRMNDKDLPKYLSLGKFWIGRFNQNKLGIRAASACMFEAMSVGLIPITSHSSENDKVIKDGFNGILVEDKNPEDIEKKLLRCLRNVDKTKAMSTNARQTIIRSYSTESVNEVFKLIFSKL